MEENHVHLFMTAGPFQKFTTEEVLSGAGIPFTVKERGGSAIFGSGSPMVSHEFLVPEDRLQEAKDALCASGIVCEVSERLLRRAIEEIVQPLLRNAAKDLSRLRHFIEVNNKETVRALLHETVQEPGGLKLLEEIFFLLDKEDDILALRVMARVLGPLAEKGFYERILESMTAGNRERKKTLLEVLPELPDRPERAQALAVALRDPTAEMREAAGESLFALGKGDFGYDPEGPEDERESAIQTFLRMHG